MAFPVGPLNGAVATINNVTYVYNSTKGAWTRANTTSSLSNSTLTIANLIISSGNTSTSTTTGAILINGVGGMGIGGNLYVGGNIVSTSTGYTQISVGTTAQRPGAAATGQIRFNSTLQSYEGYGTSNWTSLGGVKSVDGFATITAEVSPGAGDDVLRFYSGSTGSSQQVAWMSSANVSILPTTAATTANTGALQVWGGASIGGNLYVGGNLTVANLLYTNTEIVSSTEYVTGNLVANSGTVSSNVATGALVVVGGVGISGALYIANTGDVSANIGAYQTYANANVVSIQANLGAYQTYANANIATIQANLGAYQTYANANVVSIQANLGAYQTYANANIATIQANIGAYYTYANANVAAIQANIGSFYNYANTKIGTNSNSNLVVVATTTADSTTTGALVVGGGAGVAGNVNLGGNLYLSGTGARIIGDFSNATIASRVAFQTSQTNTNTVLEVIPNGSATTATLNLESDSTALNSSLFSMQINGGTDARLSSLLRGTGTYLPITFYTGGNERVRMDTGGNVMFGYTSVINPSSATNNYVFAGNIGINQSTLAANYLLDMVGPTDTSIVRLRASAATTTKAAQFILSTQNARDFVFTSQHDATAPYARIETGSAITGGLRFYNAGTEAVRIDSGGNLLVGYTASPTATTATSNFTIAGQVGIGTNTPQAKLSVSNGGGQGLEFAPATNATTNLLLSYNRSSTVYNSLLFDASDYKFNFSGTEKMRVDSGGNLWVGQTSAVWTERVGVRLSATDVGNVAIGTYTASTAYTGSLVRVQTETAGAGWKMYEGRGAGGAVYYYVDGSGGAYFANNVGVGYTSITNSPSNQNFAVAGQVGIGTSSPSYKLQIFGASNPEMRLGDSVVTYQLYTEGATAAVMGTVGSHSISVRTNATERMRVDAGGNVNVGYGATSPTATTATSNFTVAGQVGINTNAPRGKLDVTTTAGYGNNDAIVFGTGTFTYPTAQYGGQGAIVSKGTTSDARLMVQDGNGRINNYWNAYTDTGGYKYIVSGEPASRDVMTVNGLAGAEFGWYSAPSGTAGTALTWTQIARMVGGTSGFTWFSPRGTSSDFYIDVAGNVSMGGNLSITNNVSMSSNLTVSGTATVANVITTSGVFWANGSAYSSGSIVYTASATAPVAPKNGDQWYKTTTNVLYEYITDGTSSFWLDIQSPVVTGNNVVSTTTTDSLSPFLLMGA